MKFSSYFLEKMVEIIRVTKDELGDDLGQDRISAMMNAIDPELEKQLTIHLLVGNRGIRIEKIKDFNYPKKIEAIKQLRAFADLSLATAKNLIDKTDEGVSVMVGESSEYTPDRVQQLKIGLHNTGYQLV